MIAYLSLKWIKTYKKYRLCTNYEIKIKIINIYADAILNQKPTKTDGGIFKRSGREQMVEKDRRGAPETKNAGIQIWDKWIYRIEDQATQKSSHEKC